MTQAFNLSQLANNVNTSGLLNAAAGLYNQTPVANGGTGVATVASGAILVGAGTSAMTAVPAATTGNVLTASGGAWTSAVSQGGPAPVVNFYITPGTWTKPATLKGISVTVVGGGGNGGSIVNPSPSAISSMITNGGSAGGTSIRTYPGPSIPGPQPFTVGAIASSSSFGVSPLTVITGSAGTASGNNTYIAGLSGGVASGGNINIAGGYSTPVNVVAPFGSGSGGSSLYGMGGNARIGGDGSGAGFAATGYGAGGGGAFRLAGGPGPLAAGAGTQGLIIVEEFY